jgi:hypothetical protein
MLGGEFAGAGVGCGGGAIIATVQTLPQNVVVNLVAFGIGQYNGFALVDAVYARDMQACASIP